MSPNAARCGSFGSVSYDYDLIVLGGGPAGEKGAAQAAYFGKRVALIERAAEPGGAAVHTGTLPSKTLRETALFLSGYRQSELYGLTVEVKQDLAVPRLRVGDVLVAKDVGAAVLVDPDRLHGTILA